MVATGLAFKISLAPFHQWTPDVYQGAPTPVTAFMAVATKAAAFIALVRLFEVALGPIADDWQPALAALAVVSIAVGNIGALGQDSLKRLMGYSGVAQAGYMLAGVVVADRDGARGAGLLPGRLHADEPGGLRRRSSPASARPSAATTSSPFDGLGRSRPLLAWPLTICMLALAGLPGTSGFMGKLFLIEATVDGDYTWLGVVIVDRLDGLARLLPAGHRGGLDATGAQRRRPPGSRCRRSPVARRKADAAARGHRSLPR